MHAQLRPTQTTATIALLALALASAATRADTRPPNDGQRYVSVGGQADNLHNQQVLSMLSLPVGQRAWVQAGVGKSRSDQATGGRNPGIVTGGMGVAGQTMQLTVNASHRADGSKYRQTDVGSSLDWRHDGNVLGLDITHRNSRAAGTVAVANGQSGSTTVLEQARVWGNGVGVHGTLQATEHVSVYGTVARNHYKTTTQQTDPAAPGGLAALNPVFTRALLGGTSVVNRDEAALDHSAMVGASYRLAKVAVSGEYTTGQVHDSGGAMRSVELKAAVDVAPGWRVAPGVGRGSGDQGGHANFASLSATYGW
ncbi:MAG: hypothetical protein M3N82_02985 [Pseudomonadota bacterium]|nr:hypothetical protein [Pseudomonadota bacterium]